MVLYVFFLIKVLYVKTSKNRLVYILKILEEILHEYLTEIFSRTYLANECFEEYFWK